jgi:cytochrome c oxidase subunit 2
VAITPPNDNWRFKGLGKDERIWTFIMIVMILMMGIMTIGYVFVGHQNPPEEYYQFEVKDYYPMAQSGNDASGGQIVTLDNGEQALSKLDGGDIYMVASQWQWTVPTSTDAPHGIQIREGETYRLHLGSVDVLHGFELLGSNFIITIQVVPGYAYVIDFIPNETGLFRIICNEYCGTQHHTMAGFMEVLA